jgi:hypothetical protein
MRSIRLLLVVVIAGPALGAEPRDILEAFKPSKKKAEAPAPPPPPPPPAAPVQVPPPELKPAGVEGKAAVKARPTLDGTWSKLSTIGTLTGRWMTKAEQKALVKEDDPDRFLRMFGPATRQVVAAVALETGFEFLREARDRPGEAVAVPEKDVEMIWRWQTTQGRDGPVYRPQLVLRVTKVKPPTPGAAGPPGGIPPGVWP